MVLLLVVGAMEKESSLYVSQNVETIKGEEDWHAHLGMEIIKPRVMRC